MQCINPRCNIEIGIEARFCPFCRTAQPEDRSAAFSEETEEAEFGTAVIAVDSPEYEPEEDNVLVLRASDQVWHFDEDEGNIEPGKRRPLFILDEQTVHLAHTDRHLAPEKLRERVESLLDYHRVPVAVQQVQARWVKDREEKRPRLVAYLRDHPKSDIKMLLGVDYMGSWASIQMVLGVELEPHPIPPEPTKPPKKEKYAEPQFMVPSLTYMLGGGGLLAIVIGTASPSTSFFTVVGVGCILVAIIGYAMMQIQWQERHREEREAWNKKQDRLRQEWEDAEVKRKMTWEKTQAQQQQEKVAQRLSRTFKVDDMRLFCSAMRAVFQSVVDDIIEQGGEISRIEGGQGGFFQNEGQTQPAVTNRHSDAAQVGV